MTLNRSMIYVLSLCTLLTSVSSAVAGDTTHAKVSYIVSHLEMKPESEVTVGVRFQLEKDWHVYWKNPGDSGLPPKFKIKSSHPILVSKLHFPSPERIYLPSLVNFGFHHEVVLYFTVQLRDPKSVYTEPLSLMVSGSWLVCKDACVPEKLSELVSIPITSETKVNNESESVLRRAKELVPSYSTTKITYKTESNDKVVFFENGMRRAKTEFFPHENGVLLEFDSSGQPVSGIRLKNNTQSLSGLVRFEKGQTKEGLFHLDGKVHTPGSATPDLFSKLAYYDGPIEEGDSKQAYSERGFFSLEMFVLVAFAFLGGIILNLMPCVLPVLSIKLAQFTGDRRASSLWYALGVLLSFWVLVIVVVVLKSAGHDVGWGFQLQSISFVYVLLLVFFLFALNLIGALEIGTSLQRVAGLRNFNHPIAEAVFSGVITTVAATPCSGPFMASAVGAGLSGTTSDVLVIMTALGLGVASPVVLFAYVGALLQFKPKPGPWMVTLKELLAFPLFATVAWLMGVIAAQGGVLAVYYASAALVVTSFIVWLLKKNTAAKITKITFLALVVLLIGIGFALQSSPKSGASQTQGAPTSVSEVESLRKSGQGILLDFTAEWCVTCKLNEKAVLSLDRTQQLLESRGIKMYKIDWTNADPKVTEFLKTFGRNSVPLYVYYPSDPSKSYKILPQLLTYSIVEDATR